jgi:hypothetical protein
MRFLLLLISDSLLRVSHHAARLGEALEAIAAAS